jgi:hypothetical protein
MTPQTTACGRGRRISLDLHGFGWGCAALFVGLAAGVGTVVVFRRPAVAEKSI